MLSAIFVDRPRLAIVIAIVTTIAGALALYAIRLRNIRISFLPRFQSPLSFPVPIRLSWTRP